MKYDNQERLNIKTYKNLFKEYGYSYKSLDWGSKKNQLLRFKILSKIGNLNKKKILDVDCGFGDFYLWLKKNTKKLNILALMLSPI